MKIIVVYDPMYGFAIADARIEEFVNSMVAKYEENDRIAMTYGIGSETIITAIRVAIKQGRINFEDFTLKFNDKEIKFDKNGRTNDWKKGLCDYVDEMLHILIDYEE